MTRLGLDDLPSLLLFTTCGLGAVSLIALAAYGAVHLFGPVS